MTAAVSIFGELPPGWSVVPLSECMIDGAVTYGIVQPGTPDPSGIPVFRVNNFRDCGLNTDDMLRVSPDIEGKYGRTRLKGGEVLLTLVGSVGQVAVVPPSCAGHNVARAVAVMRPKQDVGARWISYCLRTPACQAELGLNANTTVQTTINLKDVKKLPIPLPPKTERLAITGILSALDDRITLLRETNATLEAVAQALFKSWFVDFDPVRAKAEGREPEGVPPEVVDLFSGELVECELGAIPKGWTPGTLGNVAQNYREGVDPTGLSEDTPYIGLEHMPRQSIALGAWEGAGKVESGKSRFMEGDILFGKLRPYFHKVGIAPVSGICSTDILVIRPKTVGWGAFCLCHFSSKKLIDYATQLSNGAKMPRVNWKDIAAYPTAIPSPNLARAFDGLMGPLFSQITRNVHRANTLAELRDTLLPRLMSGKLRVDMAEHEIEKLTQNA